MSEKIIVLHPENQPEVDIYPIIKEGSIPNSVIDNQKIKSRTIINSNIALNTLKYEVLHSTLKQLIDSKITQHDMENYLTSYYYNVEETQQYVGSEINTLHQTIQNEFYSNTAIDNMLMEKTDLSLFRQYLPSTYLNLDKQQDNQTSKLNLHANGSIFLTNSGNKTNSGNYYLPNSIVKTEDAPNGYYVLSTTNDDYQSLYNLGYYDKITTNDDGTYTITRQTGYLVLDGVENKFSKKDDSPNNNIFVNYDIVNYALKPPSNSDFARVICNLFPTASSAYYIYLNNVYGISMKSDGSLYIGLSNSATTLDEANAYLVQNPISIQYKLATSTTEKVEKNHYATYNQKFILEHNKNEAERSCNLLNTFDRSNIPTNSCLYNATLNSDGSYTSTATSDKRGWTYSNSDFRFHLTKGTYYLSVTGTISTSNYTKIQVFDTNNNSLLMLTSENNYKGSFALTSDTDVGVLVKSYDSTNLKLMLNKGSTPLPYQPYEGKTIHEKDLESAKNEINNAKQDKLVNEINIKSINGNSILGSGSLNIVADGVYTKITEGVNYYDLEWGKTYKIKMNNDNYAYCSAIPNIKFYGTFEITNFSIRYSDQGTGVGIVGPEYDYIISVSGNRYLASQGQDVKRGASATTHSKPPIRLSAYGGSTFAIYLLN